MTRFLLVASAAGLLGIVPAMAQTNQGAENVSSQDRTFVQTAAQGNEAETQAGQLAETRATTPAVREFGRWMVTDHTMLNHILASAAKREGVDVPTSPNQQQMHQISELKNHQGAGFDRTYIDAQVQDHEKTVAAVKKEASDGQNPVLKRVAASALPVVEQHLTESRELQQAPGTRSVASTQPR